MVPSLSARSPFAQSEVPKYARASLAFLASDGRALDGRTDGRGARSPARSHRLLGRGQQRDGRRREQLACVCAIGSSSDARSGEASRSRRRATLSLSLSCRPPVLASNSDGAKKNGERNPAERVELRGTVGFWGRRRPVVHAVHVVSVKKNGAWR